MPPAQPSWHRVREVFDEVAALTPAERVDRLDGLCGDDPALRAEVESLLSHDVGAGEPIAAVLREAASELTREAWLSPGVTVLHYDIVAQVGEGAMGAVWRAVDRTLGRDVAIKVLPAAVTRDPQWLARFEREARALAALNHPNIATVYAVHDVGGHRLLAMEFADGEDLSARLTHGRLSALEAIGIARQIADGLAEAHARGVVHRDLKPANIKIKPSGRVKVLDFGLAKVLGSPGEPPTAGGPRGQAPGGSAESAATSPPLATRCGLILGTAPYMAPEQARGEPVDARADIWAFGAVLFEMVSGERPFTGATVEEVVATILGNEPDWQLLPPETPPQLVHLMQWCLVKDVRHRLPHIGDAQRELVALSQSLAPESPGVAVLPRPWRRGALVSAAIAVMVVAGGVASSRWKPHVVPPTSTTGAVLAVLPFENLGSRDDDYFADGVTDEVRGKLVGLPGLRVIARESSTRYRGTERPFTEIGRDLGATYLLTATVRWERPDGSEERVRVSPELVEAATGVTVWRQPFDSVLSDVFDMQTELATRVAQALHVALAASDRDRLELSPTSNLAAYEAYLQGNAATGGMVSEAPNDLRRAASAYSRAVALDRDFALAWAQLSRTYSQLYSYGGLAPSDRDQARQSAERALALAPSLPASHLALGNYYHLVEQDWPKAIAQYTLGRHAAPRDVDLLSASADVQRRLGLWQESLANLELAHSLDPRSLAAARNLAQLLLRLRRYENAETIIDDALVVAPRSLDLLELKAMVFLARGDLASARSVATKAAQEQDRAAVAAYFATYWDLYWVLDSEQQNLLLELSPAAFDNDRMSWGIVLAEVSASRGDTTSKRLYAEAAREGAEQQLANNENDAQRHAFLGLALAYLGRRSDAVREGERAVQLMPTTRDASASAYLLHQLARIYVLVGEQDKAIHVLEHLLDVPYFMSSGWLRIDPAFSPLARLPHFERLLQTTRGETATTAAAR